MGVLGGDSSVCVEYNIIGIQIFRDKLNSITWLSHISLQS